MRIAGSFAGVIRAAGARAAGGEEIRCPACSRLLVLRSGPQVTPHFAHRPRQSCRNRPGGTAVAPVRLEQLTLFDLEPLEAVPAPAGRPAAPRFEPPAPMSPGRPTPPSTRRARRRRRRRRAWLPRLIRWLKARSEAHQT